MSEMKTIKIGNTFVAGNDQSNVPENIKSEADIYNLLMNIKTNQEEVSVVINSLSQFKNDGLEKKKHKVLEEIEADSFSIKNLEVVEANSDIKKDEYIEGIKNDVMNLLADNKNSYNNLVKNKEHEKIEFVVQDIEDGIKYVNEEIKLFRMNTQAFKSKYNSSEIFKTQIIDKVTEMEENTQSLSDDEYSQKKNLFIVMLKNSRKKVADIYDTMLSLENISKKANAYGVSDKDYNDILKQMFGGGHK